MPHRSPGQRLPAKDMQQGATDALGEIVDPLPE
jgi:hypothetical protein